ncbi:hypothetical protein C8A05DRAFT_35635 [Staphylotrichum tortipilum]|uniref:CFEM domain-containing protein n=1 Tax=Staphylotrichum tortipilum TaxID=2831512 RepID=A0AAN6RRW3_9PEZI|nr:hypothetical protein C8A05DRAFT_35635 [Staphylotrichum longicolle]
MKFLAPLLFLTSALAQTATVLTSAAAPTGAGTTDCAAAAFSAIPQCAQQCISNGALSLGCSSGTDFPCHCRQQAALFAAAQGCVNSTCQQGDLQGVISGADNVCQCNGASAVCSVPAATATATGVTVPTATGNASSPIASAVVVGAGGQERATLAFVVGVFGTFLALEVL